MQLHDGLRDVIGDDWGISRSSSRLTGDLERLLKYVLGDVLPKSLLTIYCQNPSGNSNGDRGYAEAPFRDKVLSNIRGSEEDFGVSASYQRCLYKLCCKLTGTLPYLTAR